MKSLLAPALHALAFASGWSTRQAQALKTGRILSFHGVGDETYSARAFKRLLAYLGQHFQVVSLDTLLARTDGGLTNEIALTFDDGLRNNLATAYPLLEEYGTPATFFVCPGLVENGRWLWTHEARARLANLRSPEPEAELTRMKSLGIKERTAAEDDLRRRSAGFVPTAAQKRRYDLMNWDELRQLDPGLVTIGSHSLTHPILSTLTGSELAVEIVESRRLLEQKLSRTVEFFCYPNGAHNPEVVRLAAQHYRAACTTEAGFVEPNCDSHQLPRIGIAPRLSYLAWRLHRPGA